MNKDSESLNSKTLKFYRLNENAVIPRRANLLDAGYDLSSSEDTCIPPLSRQIVSTGLVVYIPQIPSPFGLNLKFYARIAPRSGLAAKNGIDVFAGVVDAGYRGEIKVILFNSSNENFVIRKGDRIAQMIIETIITPEIEEVSSSSELEELSSLDSQDSRGVGGFGSSGV
jgi:dUTP pyrophosphatase